MSKEHTEQLKVIVSREPGLKAKELAKRIRVDKTAVNSFLYQHPTLFNKDEDHGWHLGPTAGGAVHSPPDDKGPFDTESGLTENLGMQLPEYDLDQKSVIDAAPEDRLLVTAKPGTGKTAIASARVAKFLAEDLVPSSGILVVSFTRTAVFEIKARIQQQLDQSELDVSDGADIRTIDSLAWYINDLADRETANDHEGNIRHARSCLEDDVLEVANWLAGLRHLIIDEAQDIVGERHRFIQALVGALCESAGVTILGDPHQAIYDWQADEPSEAGEKADMPRLFPGGSSFRRIELRTSYRFEDDRLAQLLDDVRDILDEEDDSSQRDRIDGILDGSELDIRWGGSLTDLPEKIQGRGDILVLVRGRAQAAALADRFMNEKCPHRIRLPNQPDWIEPWIGRVFGGWTTVGGKVAKDKFLERHEERIGQDGDGVERWDRLMTHAAGKRGTLNVDRLRSVLARPKRPPVDLCLNDHGHEGPILGTIHASKGREAPNVLVVPSTMKEDQNSEEDRVYYVALSRAKGRVRVSTGSQGFLSGGTTRSEIGRPTKRGFSRDKSAPWANLWIGEDGDLDPTWALHDVPDEIAMAQQEFLWNNRTQYDFVKNSWPDKDDEDRRRVLWIKDDGTRHELGRLNDQAHWAAVRTAQHYWPGQNHRPKWYQFLYIVGTTTHALGMESQVSLPGSLDNTKIFLAPVIRGWCKVHFTKG
ncbi:UvrD-helicase domain-containing protein [bacterium]|nr:UvrD-helicase domain-containing protein [bacterium]